MRRMPCPKTLSRSLEDACDKARSKLSTTGRKSRARSASASRRASPFSRSLLFRRFSNSASLRRWRSFSSSRSRWTNRSFSSAAAIADRSSSASAASSDSPVSSTRIRSSSSPSSGRSRSSMEGLPPRTMLAALEPLGERAAKELDDRDHARILAPRGSDHSEHPGQSLPPSVRGQYGRQARIGSETRLGAQDDAGLVGIEVARDEVEQARLLVERTKNPLQAFDVGELRLVEQLRGAVDVDPLLPLARVEREAREIERAPEHSIAGRLLLGDFVEQAAPHLVQRSPRVLPAELLARAVELPPGVFAAGLDHARQDDVGLVHLHDEDLARRDGEEPQALQHRMERVRCHHEPDLAGEPREEAGGGLKETGDLGA